MEDKQLRERINKVRGAMTIITNELNAIYGDNTEAEGNPFRTRRKTAMNTRMVSDCCEMGLFHYFKELGKDAIVYDKPHCVKCRAECNIIPESK